MTNATMRTFGHPRTLVAETAHWAVLVRPRQVALGALVLVCREPATAFGQVSAAAFADLREVVAGTEAVLGDFVSYEKINHLMLMMVDPDVHFHVIPRYRETRRFDGLEFPDRGWPGPPALGHFVEPPPATLDRIVQALRERWTGLAV
ncbi:HIT family protein [Azospirillum sp. YIM B02556]|uniref:HIT family protein n=1 Tax=Azospirillum endophyticum TaxID=2800326 RepID=A0ABS1FHJ9_9PROT|nr:HIT family protein [Azospirillum endophyticum]MBK1842672.1 HIT family protein [Azospirillum endophyticum]